MQIVNVEKDWLISGNKCLTLVSTDKNKDKLKKYTEPRYEIKDLIRSITNTSGNYDKK